MSRAHRRRESDPFAGPLRILAGGQPLVCESRRNRSAIRCLLPIPVPVRSPRAAREHARCAPIYRLPADGSTPRRRPPQRGRLARSGRGNGARWPAAAAALVLPAAPAGAGAVPPRLRLPNDRRFPGGARLADFSPRCFVDPADERHPLLDERGEVLAAGLPGSRERGRLSPRGSSPVPRSLRSPVSRFQPSACLAVRGPLPSGPNRNHSRVASVHGQSGRPQ